MNFLFKILVPFIYYYTLVRFYWYQKLYRRYKNVGRKWTSMINDGSKKIDPLKIVFVVTISSVPASWKSFHTLFNFYRNNKFSLSRPSSPWRFVVSFFEQHMHETIQPLNGCFMRIHTDARAIKPARASFRRPNACTGQDIILPERLMRNSCASSLPSLFLFLLFPAVETTITFGRSLHSVGSLPMKQRPTSSITIYNDYLIVTVLYYGWLTTPRINHQWRTKKLLQIPIELGRTL